MDKIFIFTDESGTNEKFRALGAVSGFEDNLKILKENLQQLLSDKKIKEVKFKDVGNYPPKTECAKSFIEEAIKMAQQQKIRIDILIWDITDTRHNIIGRDDKENLERMYYHLLKHIIICWKAKQIQWHPDEHPEYDYEKIAKYNKSKKYYKEPSYVIQLFRNETPSVNIEVKSVKSEEEPLIQLADLFAGIGRFSRQEANHYVKWKNTKKTTSLFNSTEGKDDVKKSARFEVIEFLANKCKMAGIKISINENNYLKSYDPNLPINFWHYEPQGNYDKAPTRKDKFKKS